MTKVFALTNVAPHLDRRPFFDQVRRFRPGTDPVHIVHMEITDYPDSQVKDHRIEDELVEAVENGGKVFIDKQVVPHTLNRIKSRLNGYANDLIVL